MPEKKNDTGYLVISAMGPDRPGLVDEFSRFVLERGCNIEDSRMAILGGEFAFIVLISGSAANVGRAQKEIGKLGESCGLSVTAKPTVRPRPTAALAFVPYRIRGTGVDHPGIVHKFSHLLAESGVNIESLETHSFNAPVSGTPLFHFDMVVQVPATLAIAALRAKLGKVAERENVDLEMQPGTGA